MIAKASEFLTASGYTLPLVGEDHPLRKTFHRTFALSAILAMAIHGAVAGGRLGADSFFEKPIAEEVVHLVRIHQVSQPRLPEEDVAATVNLEAQARSLADGRLEPVPDFDAEEFTMTTMDEAAETATTISPPSPAAETRPSSPPTSVTWSPAITKRSKKTRC